MNYRIQNHESTWGDIRITRSEVNDAESKRRTHVKRVGHGVHIQQGIVGNAVSICIDVDWSGETCKQRKRVALQVSISHARRSIS
jgi:hypothetical protein